MWAGAEQTTIRRVSMDFTTSAALITTILVLSSVAICVIAMLFSFGTKSPEVTSYRLGKNWDHEPMLFSALDCAPVAPGFHSHGGEITGGSAHGKW